MIKNHFTVVVPAYNCEEWAIKNVKSVCNQDYDNYDFIYINDASTDSTASILKELDDLWGPSRGVKTIKHNRENRRALPNLYDAVNMAVPGSIIVALDGDDWFANKKVLSSLNEVYQDPDVWITAGSYIESVGGRVVRPRLSSDFWDGNLRLKEWTLSHLRTFRKELFQSIERKDMIDTDGDFYKFTWDRVIMYPMVEMAGPEHFRPINKIHYVYNRGNPLAVDRVHRSEQLRIEADLKRKAPYKRLERLDVLVNGI